ncbi:histone deacetylase [Thiofaba sp. EF100]|uniref:histone deacetylase family protein n=1 Tax=Thiofaba sp. EF100 TaxID=3121274 RepID=UPI00322157F3
MNTPAERRRFFHHSLALGLGLSGLPAVRAGRDRRVGVVTHKLFLEHDWPGHREGAYRLRAILERIEKDGLLDRLVAQPVRPASEEELQRGHTEGYLMEVRVASEGEPGYFNFGAQDNYVNHATWEAARHAVGGLIDLCGAVARRELDSGFALVRPPGHHAEPSRAMGFCFVSNIALATRALQAQGLKRIAILDFDIHHGNGTQAVVGHDPDVLFLDLHQSNLFPAHSGRIDEMGEGPARGTIVNAPVPPYVDDAGLLALYDQVFEPVMARFKPDMLLVSAGFDGHWRDPLSRQNMTLKGFDALSRRLVAFADRHCGGRVVFTLEGGYDGEVLGHAVANSLRALLGDEKAVDPIGPSTEGKPTADIGGLIEKLRGLHGLTA